MSVPWLTSYVAAAARGAAAGMGASARRTTTKKTFVTGCHVSKAVVQGAAGGGGCGEGRGLPAAAKSAIRPACLGKFIKVEEVAFSPACGSDTDKDGMRAERFYCRRGFARRGCSKE